MFEVNNLNLKSGDILIIHFNQDVDLYIMEQLINYMKQYLPDNDVVAANSYYINGMTVIHKDSSDKIWG